MIRNFALALLLFILVMKGLPVVAILVFFVARYTTVRPHLKQGLLAMKEMFSVLKSAPRGELIKGIVFLSSVFALFYFSILIFG